MTLVSSKLEQEGFDCGIQTFSATKKIGVNQAEIKINDWLDKAMTS